MLIVQGKGRGWTIIEEIPIMMTARDPTTPCPLLLQVVAEVMIVEVTRTEAAITLRHRLHHHLEILEIIGLVLITEIVQDLLVLATIRGPQGVVPIREVVPNHPIRLH